MNSFIQKRNLSVQMHASFGFEWPSNYSSSRKLIFFNFKFVVELTYLRIQYVMKIKRRWNKHNILFSKFLKANFYGQIKFMRVQWKAIQFVTDVSCMNYLFILYRVFLKLSIHLRWNSILLILFFFLLSSFSPTLPC